MSNNKKRIQNCFLLFICLLFVPATNTTLAQVADNLENLEILQIIHTPNAGVLKRGQYQFEFRGYGDSGVNLGISMGLFDRFMFGVAYGGNSVLGYDKPLWNKLPGVLVKYRVIEENQILPALTVGFDMQGRGKWDDIEERYLFKAPGGFFALSRNFISNLGRFGVHGGMNYNSAEGGGDNRRDAFAALDFSLNEQVVLLGEYDFARDDDSFGDTTGKVMSGYLNVGVRFALAQSFVFEFDATDLLGNNINTVGREIKIVYVETFNF
ncbi:MAG: hypothetical protein P9L92_02850 [Candidatus Electryonea clarkiae]|nr:hypothetical protein [Candidatus Electryonea clarkiae]MDP8288814.1 hypothetical protein [Candidatus Electryonea clarkiae]